ncbi:hypothetical protein ES695_13495 [Candidatus Atribacteria bacterium 1244-E10-H5-B2]|nr:MAG: hypothetical protein ES695_13495 [Candidatus Atribacteria bacterium 1244-E10-H5-B2]
MARRHLSFEQKIEITKKLRRRDWVQEKAARVIGLVQSRVSEIEKGSIIDIDITAIPDLRYKISIDGKIVENSHLRKIDKSVILVKFPILL